MSTNDVPGYKPEHMDTLAMGCWAEHDDGSLILVEGVEGGEVVFELFDLKADPPLSFRDSMTERGFKEQFSWSSGKAVEGVEWCWHDKTPFPWDRIIANFGQQPSYASADGLRSAARRVGERLGIKARELTKDDLPALQRSLREVRDGLQKALDALPKD